jgi:hypothetical protein
MAEEHKGQEPVGTDESKYEPSEQTEQWLLLTQVVHLTICTLQSTQDWSVTLWTKRT